MNVLKTHVWVVDALLITLLHLFRDFVQLRFEAVQDLQHLLFLVNSLENMALAKRNPICEKGKVQLPGDTFKRLPFLPPFPPSIRGQAAVVLNELRLQSRGKYCHCGHPQVQVPKRTLRCSGECARQTAAINMIGYFGFVKTWQGVRCQVPDNRQHQLHPRRCMCCKGLAERSPSRQLKDASSGSL